MMSLVLVVLELLFRMALVLPLLEKLVNTGHSQARWLFRQHLQLMCLVCNPCNVPRLALRPQEWQHMSRLQFLPSQLDTVSLQGNYAKQLKVLPSVK